MPPPLIEIGLTGLPKTGGARAPLAPSLATGLNDVMACFVEDRYFRCKILGIEQNMPKVFLIDVGEILKVPFDSCYAIPLRFAHLKPYALLCHLNIVPKVGKFCSLRLIRAF